MLRLLVMFAFFAVLLTYLGFNFCVMVIVFYRTGKSILQKRARGEGCKGPSERSREASEDIQYQWQEARRAQKGFPPSSGESSVARLGHLLSQPTLRPPSNRFGDTLVLNAPVLARNRVAGQRATRSTQPVPMTRNTTRKKTVVSSPRR